MNRNINQILIMNSANAEIERRRSQVTRDDIDDIVHKISGVEDAFVQCKRRIEQRVEERIGEHSAILELRTSIEELKKEVVTAKGNGDDRLKTHDEEIQDCIERIEALEKTVERILLQLTQIEFSTQATNLSVSNLQSSQAESFNVIGRQISTLGDSVNIALSSKGKLKDKLPLKVWLGIGAGGMMVVVGLVAVVTGNDELLNALRGIF